MPTTINHGFAAPIADGGDYMDEFTIENKGDVSERLGTDGEIKKVKLHKLTNDFSFKGGGNPAVPLGAFATTINGLSGGAKLIKSFKNTGKNSDFDDYDCSGTHYPNGTIVT
jgi:hypothetical protein